MPCVGRLAGASWLGSWLRPRFAVGGGVAIYSGPMRLRVDDLAVEPLLDLAADTASHRLGLVARLVVSDEGLL